MNLSLTIIENSRKGWAKAQFCNFSISLSLQAKVNYVLIPMGFSPKSK